MPHSRENPFLQRYIHSYSTFISGFSIKRNKRFRVNDGKSLR